MLLCVGVATLRVSGTQQQVPEEQQSPRLPEGYHGEAEDLGHQPVPQHSDEKADEQPDGSRSYHSGSRQAETRKHPLGDL